MQVLPGTCGWRMSCDVTQRLRSWLLWDSLCADTVPANARHSRAMHANFMMAAWVGGWYVDASGMQQSAGVQGGQWVMGIGMGDEALCVYGSYSPVTACQRCFVLT